MGHGLRFQCHPKIFFPVDSGEPLVGEVVLWGIMYIKTRAGDSLGPGRVELHTLDDLTYQKHKRNNFIKLQKSGSDTQQWLSKTYDSEDPLCNTPFWPQGNDLPHLLPYVLERKDNCIRMP